MFEGDESIQNKITSGARLGFELLIYDTPPEVELI